ncbi:MAG: phosphatase PAP2 family protein [Patescibacteria group bacterium]
MNPLQSIIATDLQLSAFLISIRDAFTVKVFIGITWLGEIPTVLVLALAVSILLWQSKKFLPIIALWITIIGSESVTFALKLLLHRPRPLNAAILETSNSFPSGHATIAVAFYGFLAFLLLQKISRKLHRSLIITLTSIIILAIGFSRLYLGVHYLSDVLAGYLVGLTWLIIGIRLSSRDTSTLPAKKQSSPTI